MQKLKDIYLALTRNEHVMRVFHTAWQVGLPALFAGLKLVHSTADVKLAFVSAGAVVLAALKAALLSGRL